MYDICIRDNINIDEKEKKMKDGRRRGRGWNKMQEEETSEEARRKPKETHAVKARATYLASSCSCFIARGTAAAQTALPRAPPPSVLRRVLSRRVAFLDLRGTRRGTGGAHCVLKTSRRLRAPSLCRVRAPSEVSPPKTSLPIAPYEVPVERWLDASRGRG